MTTLAVAILLSWATGALVVWMLAPRPQSAWSVGMQLCLAMGLGLAISAALFFFARAALHYADRRILLLDASLLVAIAMLSLITARAGPSPGAAEGTLGEGSQWRFASAMMLALLLVAVLVAGASFGELFLARPHGNWDAWAMWNMKARWLYEGGPRWRLAFGEEMISVRPDYPLLLPLTIARLWSCLGSHSTIVPRLCAGLFSSLTLLLVFLSVGRTRGVFNAAAAAIALCGSQVFVDEGASQYADMPLSFFILATVVLIAAAGEAPYGMNRLWALAGLSAAAAACTKNEGQLFFAACGISTVLVRLKEPRAAGWSLIMALVGAVPLLALVVATKLMFAWQNYLFEDRTVGELARLAASSARWGMVCYWAKQLIGEIVHPVLLALVAATAAVTWLAGATRLVGHRIGGLCIILVALGYLAIYLTTPHDIGWHMRTSLSRLVLHLWPATLFLIFSSCPAMDSRSSSTDLSPAS